MFTGIVKERGSIWRVRPQGVTARLEIKAPAISKGAHIGDSISIEGVCLTVVDKSGEVISFDVIEETLRRTTLGSVRMGEEVNLEPALSLTDRLGGHILSGHVDEIGLIRKIAGQAGGVMELTIGVKPGSILWLVRKGSVAVNGISLTVNRIGRDFFTVEIIPHTVTATTIGTKSAGERVNIEFDLIGKYVLKNLPPVKTGRIDEDLLRENGFT